MGKKGIIFWIICTLGLMCGCDPVTRYKITSTILDGIPAMPPAEDYCHDYHVKKVAEEHEAAVKSQKTAEADSGSIHRPYGEKRCDNCHDQSKPGGLIRPKHELCFVCHPDIIAAPYVHGPASVGGCLECHEPHTSQSPALLKKEKGKLCIGCHREKRVAEELHASVSAKGMFCMDCHNPHAGSMKYFIK